MTERATGPPIPVKAEHVSALDGMRAIAVLLVILFHLRVPGFRAGFVGVDIFFVLSGFLITSLLLEEIRRTGRVSLSAFWARRARRLLPALVLVLLTVGVVTALTATYTERASMRGDLLATTGYVANWHFIQTSTYFADIGVDSPLEHTWSLAIEEQFYLLWPLLVFGVATVGVKPRTGVGTLALLGVAVSAGLLAVLWSPGRRGTRLHGHRRPDLRTVARRGGRGVRRVAGRPRPPRASRTVGAGGGRGRPRDRARVHHARRSRVLLRRRRARVRGHAGDPRTALGRGRRGRSPGAVVEATRVDRRRSPTAPTSGTGRSRSGSASASRAWRTSIPRRLAALALTFGLAALSFYAVERPIRSGSFLAFLASAQDVAPAARATGIRRRTVATLSRFRSRSSVVAGVSLALTRVPPIGEGVPVVMFVGDSVPARLGTALERAFTDEGWRFVSAALGGCPPTGETPVRPDGTAWPGVLPGCRSEVAKRQDALIGDRGSGRDRLVGSLLGVRIPR